MTPLGGCPLPRPCPGTDGLRAPHAWSPHTVPVPGRCSLWAQDGSAPETQPRPRRGPPFPGREGPAPACVCSDWSSPGCWPGWRRPICHLRPCPASATEGLARPPLQEVASPTNPAPRPPRCPPSPAPPLLPAPTGSTAAPAPTLQPAPPVCQARVGVNRLRKEWGGPKPLSVRVHRAGHLASARVRPQGVCRHGASIGAGRPARCPAKVSFLLLLRRSPGTGKVSSDLHSWITRPSLGEFRGRRDNGRWWRGGGLGREEPARPGSPYKERCSPPHTGASSRWPISAPGPRQVCPLGSHRPGGRRAGDADAGPGPAHASCPHLAAH